MEAVLNKLCVVILGASSGIGEATARELHDRGVRLVLGARREEKLGALARELNSSRASVDFLQVDVGSKDQVDRFMSFALEKMGRIDALVNSAGVMLLSKISDLKVDEWEAMINTNLRGVLYACASVIPHMSKSGSGHIINVSSVGGEKVFPYGAVYCATKFAVNAFSESIHQEFKGAVRCTQICPGMVQTEINDHIVADDLRNANRLAYRIAISPSHVAQAICFALAQPPDVSINKLIIRPSLQSF
ncbi:MAG: SDR family oxidoreductase [Bdellovibrionales bacterium]|nr:SDR family oxidoreductase [Bdellovibrionales bacterium]